MRPDPLADRVTTRTEPVLGCRDMTQTIILLDAKRIEARIGPLTHEEAIDVARRFVNPDPPVKDQEFALHPGRPSKRAAARNWNESLPDEGGQ